MHMIDDSKPLAQRMLQKDFQFFMDYQSAAQEPLPLLQKKNSNVEKIRSQMNAQKELGKVFWSLVFVAKSPVQAKNRDNANDLGSNSVIKTIWGNRRVLEDHLAYLT